MPGRLAVDFGTSNTVLAVWDEARQEGLPLHIPEFGRLSRQGDEQISIIPTLIHYEQAQRRWIGDQVLQKGLYPSNQTFRWMKRYILNRSPIQRQAGGGLISYEQAGQDFLVSVLLFAADALDMGDEEVAFTVPVEAYEHYENWLAGVAEAAKMPRFRLIDEPSAAALGYGVHIQPGDVYLVFDFGGGTLDVSIILIEPEERVQANRRCRVLGKSGQQLGGTAIDQWLFQQALQQNGLSDADEAVRTVSGDLLVACERVKEQLTFQDHAGLSLALSGGGASLEVEFTRVGFEQLLEEQGAFTQMDRAIRNALNEARERGYSEEQIKAVLMVGGSSQIPAVQRTLRRIFGKDLVSLNRPLDAIARGAAAFVAGVDFYDHIQHDYAIRYLDRQKGEYDYRILVPRGTAYPTPEPVARLTVKPTYEGQTHLGIAIYEMGERRPPAGGQRVELVFDPSGAARVVALSPDEEEQRSLFWMNAAKPTFLAADPPAVEGQGRFEVTFAVDGNKRLLITARDLHDGKLVYRDYPVVKLV